MNVTDIWFDYDSFYFKTSTSNNWRRRYFPLIVFIDNEDLNFQKKVLLHIFQNNKSKQKNSIKFITGYKDIFDKDLVGIVFVDQKSGQFQYKDFIKIFEENNKKYYGTNILKYKIIVDSNIEFDFKNRRYWFLDIEVESNYGENRSIAEAVQEQIDPIISIVVYDNIDNMYYQFVVSPDGKTEKYEKVDPNHKLIILKDEKTMLKTFVKLLREKSPNIISGWYSEQYDIPYLINRFNILFGEVPHFTLIPNVIPSTKRVSTKNGYVFFNRVGGIETIDYMEIYKKFSLKNPPSWSLDNVQEFEGIAGKTEQKGFLNYRTNFEKFINYIYRDVEILQEIEAKTRLLKMVIGLQQLVKMPLNNILTNSKTVEQMIIQTLYPERKILISSIVDSPDYISYAGQIVLEPEDRTFNDVMVFDFQSLYPNSIITFNISPEVMVVGEENIKELERRGIPYVDFQEIFKKVGIDDVKERFVFRLDKEGVLPKTVKMLINERLRYKRLYKEQKDDDPNKIEYDLKQYNYKIIINSLYGYLGYKYSPLFDIRLQVSVTGSARYMFMSQKEILENYDKYKIKVIYGDTDSEFIKLYNKDGSEIEINSPEEMNMYQEEITSYINEKLNEYIQKVSRNVDYGFIKQRNTERIELDKFFKRVRFFGVKKRYYGYDFNGKELFHGIELVRSDTPNQIKSLLSDLFRKQLDGEITIDDLKEGYEEVKKLDLRSIGVPKTLTELNFDNYKVIPQHARGIIFQRKIGINIPEIITDKIFVIPIIVYNSNAEVFNIQKEIFNLKGTRDKKGRCVISLTEDRIEEFKSLLDTKYKNQIEIDYFSFYEKNVLEKLKQFSELSETIEKVKSYLLMQSFFSEQSGNLTLLSSI